MFLILVLFIFVFVDICVSWYLCLLIFMGGGHYARCGHQWITCPASEADQSFWFDTVSAIQQRIVLLSLFLAVTVALYVMVPYYTSSAGHFFIFWSFIPIYKDFLFYWQWHCHWLMLIDVYWRWLMLIDADWCWLMPIDAEWCSLILINADWLWLMLIYSNWCWCCVCVGTSVCYYLSLFEFCVCVCVFF